MTKAEWISVIQKTMMKIDEQRIYAPQLIERHIQSVYEQMFNELYNQDKTKIWHYVRDYELTNEEEYDDWYLPTPSDMEVAFPAVTEGGSVLWTCGEVSATHAYAWSDSGLVSTAKGSSVDIWPIRRFSGTSGEYTVGNTGPAGGVIVLFTGSEYFEMAPVQITAAAWSNITNVSVGVGASPTDGETASNLIISQDGHTASAAKDCLDYEEGGKGVTSITLETLPVSFNRKGGGVFAVSDSDGQLVVTDRQGYINLNNTHFDTAGVQGVYVAYLSANTLYTNKTIAGNESLTLSIVPKFTSLASTDEVLIPGGAEDHFIDRVIDTIKHMTPVDLFNDNTVQ